MLAALAVAVLAAATARADFYRWTDSDGVTHYAQDPDRVPRRYRSSVQVVKPHEEPARGALPSLEVRSAPPAESPAADEGGFLEPGLEERAASPPSPLPGAAQPPVGAGGTLSAPAGAPGDADPRESEIAELERELAARREELKTLISETSFDSSRIATDARLRELAESVPRLQAELDALRSELDR